MKNFFRMPKKDKATDKAMNDELLDSDTTTENDIEQANDGQEASEADAGDKEAQRITELEQEVAAKDDRHLRLYAEFENFKRRSQREKLDLMETAGRKTMLALLPVLDDLDRAVKQAESDEDTKKVWDSGVGLIHKKLLSSLAGQGLKPMVSTGEEFNADLHEAITEIPSPEMAGKVVDTVERGYTLNGTIIRFAKVVVGK